MSAQGALRRHCVYMSNGGIHKVFLSLLRNGAVFDETSIKKNSILPNLVI
jgi:hypothetical protein